MVEHQGKEAVTVDKGCKCCGTDYTQSTCHVHKGEGEEATFWYNCEVCDSTGVLMGEEAIKTRLHEGRRYANEQK